MFATFGSRGESGVYAKDRTTQTGCDTCRECSRRVGLNGIPARAISDHASAMGIELYWFHQKPCNVCVPAVERDKKK